MSGDAWQQERSQLRAKLAQAGNHLKTLTQENASLKKRIAMEEKQRKDLEETRKKDLDTANQTKTELVSLLQEYFKEPVTIDVSNPVQLKEYFENVKVRLQEQTAQNDESDTIAALKSQIEQLKIQGSSTENIVTNSCDIKTVDESLKDIVMDPENASLNSSLPPGLLRTLENLRGHLQQQALSLAEMKTQNASMAENAQKDLKRQITQLQLSNNEMMEQNDKLTTDKEELERRLKECEETAKRISEESELKIAALKQEHKSLLDKLAHIKNTLAPRLEADKQLRLRNTELTTELETTQQELEHLRRDLLTRDEETGQIIAQKERDMSQLQMRLEKVQREREEVEMMAMQMDARRSQLEEQAESTQSELRRLQTRLQEEQEEKESERASLANLQTVLEEFQATKDAEIRAAVEHIERQLEVAKKSWNEYQERARVAEASLEQYQRDVAKAQQYEREIKEKNLLIGKLRHEAIILNEHLVEAMRRLKEESSENNVDR
ncbi:hypothetical protein EC973_001803 [Apophysomyces ossiformis]|uniref:Uncharacterized protein n=1 Tax=Apophysomyces ossiformis TaxID=679940 RepID=A0A8H7BPH7_9FUNG|nr:hypothetical protein EC973_001803 [Apophysomyces ossiformis]